MRASWLPWFSVGSSLALLLALWLAGGFFLGHVERQAEADLAELEPRYARLAGLSDKRERILADLEAQNQAIGDMAYPKARDPNRIAADLQQELRRRIGDADAQVRGSSVAVVEPEDGKPFGRVAVSVTMSGTLDAVRAAFFSVAEMRPVVYPVSARMQAESLGRAEEGDQRLSLEMRFESLHLGGAQ